MLTPGDVLIGGEVVAHSREGSCGTFRPCTMTLQHIARVEKTTVGTTCIELKDLRSFRRKGDIRSPGRTITVKTPGSLIEELLEVFLGLTVPKAIFPVAPSYTRCPRDDLSADSVDADLAVGTREPALLNLQVF